MVESQRLVVRAPNWLGDAVMALPAIAAIRRQVDRLILAAPPSIAPLFGEETDAAPDEIVAIDHAREIRQLRETAADAILLLPNSFGSAWRARRSRIPQRLGYGGWDRRWLLTRSARRPRGRLHQVAYYLELVRALGYEAADDVPRVRARAGTRARADALLQDARVPDDALIVGLAPGAAYGHAKRWSPRRVAQLVARLAERGATAVMVGAADDRETGREIESSLPRDVGLLNLIGRTSLGVLVGVLERCAAFVSNDSGAMHVAAAVGVPLTALFGPTDERVTAPMGPNVRDILVRDVFCRPCMLRDCPIDHRCMKRITVDDVVQSVEKHLAIRTTGSIPRS